MLMQINCVATFWFIQLLTFRSISAVSDNELFGELLGVPRSRANGENEGIVDLERVVGTSTLAIQEQDLLLRQLQLLREIIDRQDAQIKSLRQENERLHMNQRTTVLEMACILEKSIVDGDELRRESDVLRQKVQELISISHDAARMLDRQDENPDQRQIGRETTGRKRERNGCGTVKFCAVQ